MSKTNSQSKYLIAVSLDSYEAVQALARSLESVGIVLLQASAIDKEFYGHAPKHSYVMRSLDGETAKARENTRVGW